MKFNYKKIATVIGSALMIGSTVGIAAAAAYPAPFVQGGVADVAAVYGANAATSDVLAAANVNTNLATKLAAQTTTGAGGEASASGGDNVPLQRTSDKLHLGNGITDVYGTSITKSDMKTLLADGVFYNKQNNEYKYTQSFDVGNFTFQDVSDSDLDSSKPQLGFRIDSGTFVGNYSITFSTNPESTIGSDQSLTDFENKNIILMGKNYYILDFKNGTTPKLTLLDAATSSSISEGETKTITVGTTTYEVSINFITSGTSGGEVILTVNGQNTEKMSDTGTNYGNTFKLSDGTYIGVKSVNVQNYAGGIKNVDFSIGKGKLEINGAGGNVKINDKTISDLYGFITLSPSTTAGKTQWQKLVIKWKPDTKKFLTPSHDLTMPGFEAIKFTMADTTIAAKEITKVEYGGTEYMQLKTTLKSGDITIPILYQKQSEANLSAIGQSRTQQLATSATQTLVYNDNSSVNTGFIASWASTKDSETYYLTADVTHDYDNGKNTTTIYDISVPGTKTALCSENLEPTNTCKVGGNVVLTVTDVRWDPNGQQNVTLGINTAGGFNTVYTKSGLTIILPTGLTPSMTTYPIQFLEENKDGTLGAGARFNVTIGTTGTVPSKKISALTVEGITDFYETSSGSKLWEGYVVSELGTKVTHDKTSSDQYTATIEYHDTEMFANVFAASPAVTVVPGTPGTPGSVELGDIKVTDAQVSSVSDKNLIVIGGSCINVVAAKVLGATTPVCGAEFTALTGVGAGEYLIKTVSSPYNSAKVAMLVAGYEGQETSKGVMDLINGAYDTTAGMTYKGTLTTVATAVTA